MENEALNRRLIVSEDGSHTIRVDGLKEHYHSHKGAVRESRHVFLEMGLSMFQPDDFEDIRVLEVGFGTGLNALLTILAEARPTLTYVGLEPYPVEMELIKALNYPDVVATPGAADLFQQLHALAWNETHPIQNETTFEKRIEKLEDHRPDAPYHLVYYDAFAPHAQPELWYPSVWQKLIDHLVSGGILVTYCAKGQVRRDMQAAGFEVQRLPGPPGKREMLRARKP